MALKNKLTPTTNEMQGMDVESIQESFVNHLEYSLAKQDYSATQNDIYKSVALLTRDRLIERWIETQHTYNKKDPKRVYYLSLEFLIGRTLGNSLVNLGLYDNTHKAMEEMGYNLEDLREKEWDAGLGNGGLGRLAACFMDSLSTLELPAVGYGIRYEYGIFFQQIINGYQVETPDNWLRLGNPWEFPRPEYLYPVNFYGRVEPYDDNGELRYRWVDTELIMAMAYDTPVPGYKNNTVNNLRLWSAKASREFDLNYFNDGDYVNAVSNKSLSENITKVLYPNDNIFEGKELRLKQQYFFVSATLQDIIRRYRKCHETFDQFPDKVAIQLNDTHPSISIPELMRIFIDEENMQWDAAWSICTKTFGYTNHTVLPEALEKWSVSLMEKVLPRHMQIIYEINSRFLKEVESLYSGNTEMIKDLSIIEESGDRKVRMANLSIIGSHSVNGVAALHTEIIKRDIFKNFYIIWPDKFNNKTNGVTQRRWLKLCNPELSDLIDEKIGDAWTKNFSELKKLEKFSDDRKFQEEWMSVKRQKKLLLADYIKSHNGIDVNVDSIFDIQVKRIHEYKRQLLNALHVIALYNKIKDNPNSDAIVPRTVIFAGKAAPGYYMAKLIIKLITSIGDVVNNDPDVAGRLKVLFLRNYAVSNAQKIIPAADLSEQISTAGMEASGTGNMKFSINGALTIGTLDGANVEICEEVGEENIFIFGLNTEEVNELKKSGYKPHSYYSSNPVLKRVVDQIQNGFFSPQDPGLFRPIVESLLHHGDRYMIMADFEAYMKAQELVDETFVNREKWARMSILNTANMGKFSTDRTITEYSEDIWGVVPVSVEINQKNS